MIDAVSVAPADDQLGGHDRADAGLVEEFGHQRAYVVEDLALERLGFAGGVLDATSELAQHEDGGELGGGA